MIKNFQHTFGLQQIEEYTVERWKGNTSSCNMSPEMVLNNWILLLLETNAKYSAFGSQQYC